MDYEKKYKEANKKVAIRFGSNVAKEIFQDLYESEDERIRKELLAVIDDLILPDEQKERFVAWLEKQGQTFTKKDVDDAWLKGMCDAKDELEKQGEQKPFDNDIKEALRTEYEKGRADVLAEQKPEWSEEEEDKMILIEDSFSDYLDYVREDNSLTKHQKNSTKDKIVNLCNWLKSLKERYTWKPSDEQMELLREVQQALLGKDCHNKFVNFMYELKRLREE